MENGHQRPIGLTIQLKKYGLDKFINSNRLNDKRILGHYDTLEIQTISKWFDFSPKVDWNLDVPRNEPLIISRYPIKLLFPGKSELDRLSGFNFTGWEDSEKLLFTNPCITAVLVKLTDGFKRNHAKDLLYRFASAVIAITNRSSFNLNDINCGVFPSLGYSDFCVLCAGTNWRSSLNLIESLHAMRDTDGTPIVSTDYMITAFHSAPGVDPQCLYADVQLSVRLNLNPGCTAQTLAGLVPTGVEVYRTSGGSDCALIAKTPAANTSLIDFLLQNNDKAASCIIDMASALQLRVDNDNWSKALPQLSDVMDQIHQAKRKVLDETMLHYSFAISEYEKMLIANKRPVRQVNVLREIAVSFENIALQNHSAQITNILNGLFKHFTHSLKICIEQVNNCNHDLNIIGNMEQEIRIFCEYIVSYLADLSRSDCFFMERERYNHPSISSSTKLLLAYNKWLNEYTELVQKSTLPNSSSEYSFLVTSGGCDQTRNFDAFHFMEPRFSNGDLFERTPNIVQMSEMSIFDFSGTILRTFHECMHNCGKRLRIQRVEYFFKFASLLYATIIARAIFQRDRHITYAYTVITKLCQDDLDKTVAKNIRSKLYANHDELERGLINSINEYLLGQLESRKPSDWTEVDALSRNLRDWMVVELADIFSVYQSRYSADGHESLHFSDFAKKLYDLAQQTNKKYLDLCNKLCLEFNISTKVFAFDLERYSLIAPNDIDIFDSERMNDSTANRMVQVILSQLTMSGDVSGYISCLSDTDEPVQRFPYISLGERNIWDVLQISVDIFSEAFADMAACKTLGVEFEDYILMHTFEDWDLAEVFETDSFSNQFRIPSILILCFPECLDMEKEGFAVSHSAKTRVEKAVNCLIAHGMPEDRLDLTDLWKRVNCLLCAWAKNKEIGEWLLTYLKACMNIYEDIDVVQHFEKIRSTYCQIKLRKIDPNADDYREQINQMVKTLTEWDDDNANPSFEASAENQMFKTTVP